MDLLLSVIVELDDIFVCRVHLQKMHIRLTAPTDGFKALDMLIFDGLATDYHPGEVVEAWVTLEFVLNKSAQGGGV